MTTVFDRELMAAAFAEAARVVKSGTAEERSGSVLPLHPVTELRQSLGLRREEFAARYRIPLATLEAWERGTAEPDAVAKALLALIEADPEGAARKLAERTPAAAE